MRRASIYTKYKDGTTLVRMLIKDFVNSSVGLSNSHLISVKFYHNNKVILFTEFNQSMADETYFEFEFEGGKRRDKVSLKWLDDSFNTGLYSTVI